MKRNNYVLIRQTNEKDCGVASLNMLLIHCGEKISLDYLKRLCNYNNCEMSFYDLYILAYKLDYIAEAYYIKNIRSIRYYKMPYIAQIEIVDEVYHFVVVFAKKRKNVLLGDPSKGIYYDTINNFNKHFTGYILKIKKYKFL